MLKCGKQTGYHGKQTQTDAAEALALMGCHCGDVRRGIGTGPGVHLAPGVASVRLYRRRVRAGWLVCPTLQQCMPACGSVRTHKAHRVFSPMIKESVGKPVCCLCGVLVASAPLLGRRVALGNSRVCALVRCGAHACVAGGAWCASQGPLRTRLPFVFKTHVRAPVVWRRITVLMMHVRPAEAVRVVRAAGSSLAGRRGWVPVRWWPCAPCAQSV
eukprot:1151444-Pelagomonas_calceolata.AAC.5